MSEPKKQIASNYGGIYMRQHYFEKAGHAHKGHLHHVNHITLVAQGAVRVRFGPDGSHVQDYTAPAVIEIDKDVQHQLTALTDNTTYFCVFNTADSIDAKSLASMQAGMCDECVDGSGCELYASQIGGARAA